MAEGGRTLEFLHLGAAQDDSRALVTSFKHNHLNAHRTGQHGHTHLPNCESLIHMLIHMLIRVPMSGSAICWASFRPQSD